MNTVVSVGLCILPEVLLVFVNKAVLNIAFHIPLTFIFLQLVFGIAFLHASALFSTKISLPTRAEITWPIIKRLTSIILVNLASLVFGMLCLRNVDMSFYSIAQGLILPFTVMTTLYATKSLPSFRVLICASFVILGFLVGILPFSLFSLSLGTVPWPTFSSVRPLAPSSKAISLLYGILSSLCTSFHAILIKKTLPCLEDSPVKLVWWSYVGGAFVLLPVIVLAGDISFVSGLIRYGIDIHGNVGGMGVWRWWYFLLGSVVTGFFRSLLCITGTLGMTAISPISRMFSSIAKGVLQALFGVWFFGDILTVSRASSILAILIGTSLSAILTEARECALGNGIEIIHEMKDTEEGLGM